MRECLVPVLNDLATAAQAIAINELQEKRNRDGFKAFIFDLKEAQNNHSSDNADRNASLVIKKRAIKLLLDTGTVLSARGVLTLSDKGRGAKGKTGIGSLVHASGDEPSKKKRTVSTKVAA